MKNGTATPEFTIILHIYKIIKSNSMIYQINTKYIIWTKSMKSIQFNWV